MKAIGVDQLTGSRRVKFLDLPVPEPLPDEVLIQVHAAGIGQWDLEYQKSPMHFGVNQLPRVLGWEGAGVVLKFGDRVDRFQSGDRVCFCDYPSKKWVKESFVEGAFEEYVCIRESAIGKLPDELDFVEGAAFPIAALTPFQGLHRWIRPKEKSRILITGGAGAVATCAVQLARQLNLEVLCLASQNNFEYLRNLGANGVFDYHHGFQPEIMRKYGGVDSVYHCTLNEQTGSKAAEVLKPGGTFCTITSFPAGVENSAKMRTLRGDVEPNGIQLEKLAQMIVDGKLNLSVDKVFPFEQAEKALEHVGLLHTRGKSVLMLHH